MWHSDSSIVCLWHRDSSIVCLWHRDSSIVCLWHSDSSKVCLWHRDSSIVCLWHRDSSIVCLWHRDSSIVCLWHRDSSIVCLWHSDSSIVCLWHRDSSIVCLWRVSRLEGLWVHRWTWGFLRHQSAGRGVASDAEQPLFLSRHHRGTVPTALRWGCGLLLQYVYFCGEWLHLCICHCCACFFLCQCHSITLRIWSTSAICSFSWCVTCSLCLLLWGRVFFGISTTLVHWGHDLILKHTLVKEWLSVSVPWRDEIQNGKVQVLLYEYWSNRD